MPTVQSNSEYVKSSATGITSSVNSASVMGGVNKTTFSDSTSSCPTLEPNIVELFLGCCKELFRRIKNDTENIAKVGDGFVTMDNVMAGYATQLNMEVKSGTYAVGDVALTESKETDSLSNSDVRKQIEAILAEKGSDFKLPDRSKKADDSDDNDDDDGGSYGYYGTPSGISDSTPEKTPTVTTEAITEVKTEIVTEAETEAQTETTIEEPSEVPTENNTEAVTEVVTEVKTEPQVVSVSETKTSKKPTKTVSTYEEPKMPSTQVETEVDEPYVEEEPIIEDEIEELPEVIIDEDNEEVDSPIIDETIEINEEQPAQKKSGNGIGAAAAILGAGAVVAGGAIAANKYLNKKSEEEGEEWGDEA